MDNDTDDTFVNDFDHLDDLEEDIMNKDSMLSFDPKCVRQKSNWSKRSKIYRFDELDFNPKTLLKDMPEKSPKLNTLSYSSFIRLQLG